MEGYREDASNESPCPSPSPSIDHPPPSVSPLPTPIRLWRPAAQKNVRNQWSYLLSYKDRWLSTSSDGRACATDLVNYILSQRYMPQMDLGALKDMPDIQLKACTKLASKQSLSCKKLLSSYKKLVHIVCDMIKVSGSMRCFLKASANSSLVQFSNYSVHVNDTGDGGGIPVFSSWSIKRFEKLSAELADMFAVETLLKRLIAVELLVGSYQQSLKGEINMLSWSSELYPGEFCDLDTCHMLCKETCQALCPKIKGWDSEKCTIRTSNTLNSQVFQVYLTAWLSNMNIDVQRLEDILCMVEDEMKMKLR